jgi:hypothetical protein
MLASWYALAAADWQHEWRQHLLWAGPIIAGALLLAALVIAWVKRWSQSPSRQRSSAQTQLTHFRTLYERGELSSEEFNRVRALLAERVKKELEEPAVTPPPEPPPGRAVEPKDPGPSP